MPNQYVNKVNLADGTSIIDISDTTATADKILQGYGAYGANGAWMDGTAVAGGGSAVTVVDTPDSHGGTIRTITAVSLAGDTVSAAHLESGYTAHDALGNAIVGQMSPGGTVNLQTKDDIDPTESSQTITADTGYDGLDSVQINGIPSSYVGSGVTRRSSSDLSASGATVSVPAGYYASSASKAVSTGTAGTPTATKGTVSNHSVSVTPSVTNTTGYITGSTKTGTAVSVSASELVSGSQTITHNGTVDVTNLAQVVVNVSGGGGGGMNVATATATPSTASSSISFTGLSGEPTSFYVVSASDLATGASPYKTAAVVFDGTDVIGTYITNTNNAQVSFSDTAFSKTYSNGTLTITGSGTNFQANQYKLVYTYGGSSSNIGTADVQVGSGATSITFTGLSDEPSCFSCLFKSNFATSSGYTRTIVVVHDGTSTYGMEMGSGAEATTNWSYTYNNGSLTISSQSTSAGGYFHQPGYYQLTYGVGGEISIDVEPLTVTQNGTYAESGKAYSPVVVNVSGGGGKAVQVNSGAGSVRTTSYSSTGISITVAKAGTYKVSWMGWKSSSSGTMGTNLYVNGNAGTKQTSWTNNYGQHITLSNQTYAAGDVLTLYAVASSTSRYCGAGNLIIEEQ